LTVAELAHGIYRAQTAARRHERRQFLDELKAHIPIYPITDATAEIIARIDGEQAAQGINPRWLISSSAHAPWNSAMQSVRATSATSVASLA
jgi:predicted nucleic acid-binding protein